MPDELLTIDFETEGIEGNPIWSPPKPVGVSIKWGEKPSHYWAWGHPTENNCSFEQARHELLSALKETKGEFLAHNAAFESAVLEKYFGWVTKDPLKIHDTMFLLFLTDPYAQSFALKSSAERILGLAPDEQAELRDWILAHVPEAKASNWGAYICKAPGDLVGRYARGDTDRTFLLHQTLYPRILQAGMLDAYRREQRLSPILAESSKRGVRVDVQRLGQDIQTYLGAKKKAEEYIFGVLGEFEMSKDAQLAAALDAKGLVTDWVLTPTGRKSVARKNLVGRVKDPKLMDYITYHGLLTTCLGTFAGPWIEQALREGGRLHSQWNQVRGDRGTDGDIDGTRTGRMSCKIPNLQNVVTDFEGLAVPDGLPPMIHMRSYLLPEEGHVWLKRDFSAQEMRIMAHFAEGRLFEAFRADPKTDPHDAVKKMIDSMVGGDMPRKYVKITGFGIMYGRGVANLSLALGINEVEGKKVRDAYYAALPEIQSLSYDTRNRGKRGQYIRTWGGRIYYREPNPDRDLSYKLLNYLIQGSAADQTKQAMIDWDENRAPTDILLAAVHDEINISVPEDDAAPAMRRLREQMDKDRFDVPFRSEGFKGLNWSDLEEYEA
jgi:DNA polymerase I-like protein with 3'-5' exonuclease and polymerase domains